MNWRNTLFRLWIVLTIVWELFVIFMLITEDLRVSILFALIWPFAFLAVFVIVVKLGLWVFAGLKDKNGKIEKLINQIDSLLTMENCFNSTKKAFISFSSRKNSFIVSFLCVFVTIIFLLMSSYHSKSLGDPWTFFPNSLPVSSSSNSKGMPPLPPGFVLDKTRDSKDP